LVSEAFSGSIIDLLDDDVELFLCEVAEAGAFGQVATNESVGILVGTALPGTVGLGEVDVGV